MLKAKVTPTAKKAAKFLAIARLPEPKVISKVIVVLTIDMQASANEMFLKAVTTGSPFFLERTRLTMARIIL